MSMQKAVMGMLSLVAIVATTASADVHTGNMVKNPFMTDNKDDWTTTTPWRPNGAANLVHDFKTDGTAGFASAIAATRDLTLDVDITTDANYDANTTKLTDLSFGNVWVLIPNWNTDKIGANMSGNFYCEVEIATLSGNTYRGSSNKLTVDTSTTAGGYGQVFTLNGWASYGDWDGNPFDAGDGIALGDIDTIDYKWVMQTVTANTDGTGTVFFQADNASLNYEVTTIPEPATLGMLMVTGGGIFWVRRKLMI